RARCAAASRSPCRARCAPRGSRAPGTPPDTPRRPTSRRAVQRCADRSYPRSAPRPRRARPARRALDLGAPQPWSIVAPMIENATRYIDEHFDHFLNELKALSRIPSISADPDRKQDVRASALAVRDAMRAAGLESCEVIELRGAHPYVYGEWLHAPGKP